MPYASFSGTSSTYTNPYNGSNQFNYAAKHNPQLFFTDTNGGTATTPDTSTTNPFAQDYAPLQQLAADLANNTEAAYNWISPDQYNDMHTALTGGFTYNGVHYTGDEAEIAQGDNFLAQIVPLIEASQAFKDDGEIVIWNDETEGEGSVPGVFTSMEIVISPLAKGNAYTNDILYDHSNDLATLQQIFGASGRRSRRRGRRRPHDRPLQARRDSFPVPETGIWAMMPAGFAGLAAASRRKPGAARLAAVL